MNRRLSGQISDSFLLETHYNTFTMKKIFYAGCLFLTSFLQAQITVTTTGNQVISDDQVFTFSTTGPSAEIPFKVTNIGTDPINVKILMSDITNATGANFTLCFGVCLYNVTEGTYVPPSFPITIEAGDTTPAGDHFMNNNPGDGLNPITYAITFVQVDDDGNYLQDLMNITYIYNSALSTGDFSSLESMGVTVEKTLVDNTLNIATKTKTSMDIFNVNGQLLRNISIDGNQSVDISALASGVYVLHFATADHKQNNIRIIKK